LPFPTFVTYACDLPFRRAGVGPATSVQRQIARTLLVLLLVGVFAPVGLAMSVAPPHACCMRKMHEGGQQQQWNARHCANHDCCRAVTAAQSAVNQRQVSAFTADRSARLTPIHAVDLSIANFHSSYSGRAPPAALPIA
jgi:hypothetical protein